MRTTRLLTASVAAFVSADMASAAAIDRNAGRSMSIDGMPMLYSTAKSFSSSNKRAPGAHKANHRAAHKLRRVKAARARARG